jgi:hypothetical protein
MVHADKIKNKMKQQIKKYYFKSVKQQYNLFAVVFTTTKSLRPII